MLEQTLDLPVDDTANYSEFMSMSAVKDLLIMNPTMTLVDVTPDGMPDSFSDEERMRRQLLNMGIKKSLKENGAPEYEDIEEE